MPANERRNHVTEQPSPLTYRPRYRDACLPNAEWQRVKIESLRYRFLDYKHGTHIIGRLAAWIRRHFVAS